MLIYILSLSIEFFCDQPQSLAILSYLIQILTVPQFYEIIEMTFSVKGYSSTDLKMNHSNAKNFNTSWYVLFNLDFILRKALKNDPFLLKDVIFVGYFQFFLILQSLILYLCEPLIFTFSKKNIRYISLKGQSVEFQQISLRSLSNNVKSFPTYNFTSFYKYVFCNTVENLKKLTEL